MSEIIFSCIIPCRDINDSKLFDLISSIKGQDFPQDQIEILTIAEGDSEQAKAIGIRRAQGKICAMFCADNYLIDKRLFGAIGRVFQLMPNLTGAYTKYYHYKKNDTSLNRYFSLMGNNDPIAYYLGKSDRRPYFEYEPEIATQMYFGALDGLPSLGDNGFFFRREHLLKADLDHYYPMDVCEDLRRKGYGFYHRGVLPEIWHRTADKLLPFLIKRYKYARDLYCDRKDRRWDILRDNNGNIEYRGLLLFIASTITIIPSVCISVRGFFKIRDWAWFWHWPVCFGFLIIYTLLAFRNLLKYGKFFCRQQALLSQPLAETSL